MDSLVNKKVEIVFLLTLMITLAMSCHKSQGGGNRPASLNIVNAIATSNGITPILGGEDSITYFLGAQQIYYENSQLYSPLSGANPIYVIHGVDTTNPKLRTFDGTLNLAPGGIYSFFLFGDTVKADTLFLQDFLPRYGTDSFAGLRLVNLSPDSGPISMNLEGNPSSNYEFSNIRYKNVSNWKLYPANSSVPGQYNFEIRSQTNDSLLWTYSWTFLPFKTNTIIISGSIDPNSETPLQVWQMNNF